MRRSLGKGLLRRLGQLQFLRDLSLPVCFAGRDGPRHFFPVILRVGTAAEKPPERQTRHGSHENAKPQLQQLNKTSSKLNSSRAPDQVFLLREVSRQR